MGLFGWDYPPGCHSTPYDYEPPPQPRCHCGAFVSCVADGYDEREVTEEDAGPDKPCDRNGSLVNESVRQIESPWGPDSPKWWAWTMKWTERIPYTVCKKCGARVPLGE